MDKLLGIRVGVSPKGLKRECGPKGDNKLTSCPHPPAGSCVDLNPLELYIPRAGRTDHDLDHLDHLDPNLQLHMRCCAGSV